MEEDIGHGDISGVQIVGLFGVIGKAADDTASDGYITNNGTQYSYASANTEVKNLNIDSVTIRTQTSASLAGIAAGYVNGEVSSVTVDSSQIVSSASAALTGITSALSDYSLVGYCTEEYRDTMDICTVTHDVTVEKGNYQTTETGNAWGGSISMDSLYNRLADIYDEATDVTYVSAETRTEDAQGNTTVTGTTNGTTWFKNKPWDGTGQYSFSKHSSGTKQYLYLYGKKNYDEDKTVTTTSTQTYTGVKIKSNGYFLNANTSGVTNNGQDESAATVWVIENNRIYTYLNNNVYYLRYYNSALTVSTTNSYNV